MRRKRRDQQHKLRDDQYGVLNNVNDDNDDEELILIEKKKKKKQESKNERMKRYASKIPKPKVIKKSEESHFVEDDIEDGVDIGLCDDQFNENGGVSRLDELLHKHEMMRHESNLIKRELGHR